MSTPVRVAMIGLDHWYTAFPLAKAFAAHPEVEVVGIADEDPARVREVAAAAGLDDAMRSEQQLLDDPRVDVVAAFASTDRNPAICVAAAGAGKHILSIKPLANTLDDASRIRSAVHKAGVAFVPAESRQRAGALGRQLRTWNDE
ncbi:MAG TPA: Gfo/Idh/MocA family oxidoreductase, partial [Actinopolymorphaceae bacterium]|nr:Gfo/Idh/MocA family oxidoreductase [Actinopolymorphaceae bacterium]